MGGGEGGGGAHIQASPTLDPETLNSRLLRPAQSSCMPVNKPNTKHQLQRHPIQALQPKSKADPIVDVARTKSREATPRQTQQRVMVCGLGFKGTPFRASDWGRLEVLAAMQLVLLIHDTLPLVRHHDCECLYEDGKSHSYWYACRYPYAQDDTSTCVVHARPLHGCC